MRQSIISILAIFTVITLAGCNTTGTSAATNNTYNKPVLSGHSVPTSRSPSPGNIQRSNMMQSTTMLPVTN